jgi:hypothetical protein
VYAPPNVTMPAMSDVTAHRRGARALHRTRSAVWCPTRRIHRHIRVRERQLRRPVPAASNGPRCDRRSSSMTTPAYARMMKKLICGADTHADAHRLAKRDDRGYDTHAQ